MISRDLLGQVERLLRPLRVRLANMVARATVEFVRDTGKMQKVQLTVHEGQVVDDVERFQPYGFSSIPLAGAEGVVVHPGGDGGHPIAVVVDDRRYRPTGGQGGQVTLYTSGGQRVDLMPNGDIVLQPAAGRFILLGSASSSDPVALKSDLTSLKTYLDAHAHTGVTTGGGTSGPPAAASPAPTGAPNVKA